VTMVACLACSRAPALNEYFRLKQFVWPELQADCERNDIPRNIADGIAFAVFEEKAMVSVSSVPRVAHMSDRVGEVGVDTHLGYRGRGYEKCVVS
jgi:predicted GNAT family acetyltransferase